MAFRRHNLFVQRPQTILTLPRLTPALLLHTHHSITLPIPNTRRKSHVRYAVSSRNSTDPLLPRRSANYHPNIWDFEFVESLISDYKSEICRNRAQKLRENVRAMFVGASGLQYSLKLIDTVQRLGLDYHFRSEIKSALDKIYNNGKDNHFSQDDLTIEALRFRLYRQHGYEISQDVLKNFVEENNQNKGKVKDLEGLLSLYEASFYACEGEEILNEAQQVTTKHLKNCLKERNDNRSNMSISLEEEISHSLELPLLWRVPRMEVRRYINMYDMKPDMQPTLLELAKLYFNMVQATYHEELKYASRWWRDLALHESLSFARNRLVECFFWNIGFNSEPEFGNLRKQMTKVCNLVTVIVDVYDVYGSLDELKMFTEAIQSGEIYVRHSWWKQHGTTVVTYQYTDNAWITIAGPLVSVHAYSQLGDQEIRREAFEYMNNNQSDLIRWSSMIFRLADDLATSKVYISSTFKLILKFCIFFAIILTCRCLCNYADRIQKEQERGDVAKSIQCYMHETGASESIARQHVQHLISDAWEKMNTSLSASRGVFPSSFINIIQNIGRMGQYMYQYGDGYGTSNRESKDRIMSIIVNPIPVNKMGC
ncbi:hypothetical protein MKW94_007351 [Papaver nudicaule]|uniref:Uncharacterized protein n=1 Tax=Papaver nudicaule TaxID=74823 RepID=A0AA42AUD0_PAPNU|nr:hypothetical protein [Papaver nudicaule]